MTASPLTKKNFLRKLWHAFCTEHVVIRLVLSLFTFGSRWTKTQQLLIQTDLPATAQVGTMMSELITIFFVEAFFVKETEVKSDCLDICRDQWSICCRQPRNFWSVLFVFLVQRVSVIIVSKILAAP